MAKSTIEGHFQSQTLSHSGRVVHQSSRKDDVARDPELAAMAAQYFEKLNSAAPDSVKRAVPKISTVSRRMGGVRGDFRVV